QLNGIATSPTPNGERNLTAIVLRLRRLRSALRSTSCLPSGATTCRWKHGYYVPLASRLQRMGSSVRRSKEKRASSKKMEKL
ncbi:AAEL005161-PA, partial [Aedes aegypti]